VKKIKTFLGAMLFIFSLACCAWAQNQSYSDPSKTIETDACKDDTITLESNKTTGYGWDLSEPVDENTIKFISCEYVTDDTGLVGSGGKEIWIFRPVCPGKATISFKYARPWEKDDPNAKKAAFTVIVK